MYDSSPICIRWCDSMGCHWRANLPPIQVSWGRSDRVGTMVYRVRRVEEDIVLQDETRLAARLWLPEKDDGEIIPSPAILEYLPYFTSVWTSRRDALRHPVFCRHGYACIRVDMRGSGDSQGVYTDEYTKQEQDDACQVLKWIAAQSWYNNKGVAMYGKSWGGFNGLQVASLRPPQLKAVVSLYSTDDRYADDVHYIGGAVMGSWMLTWGMYMLVWNARPPNPRVLARRCGDPAIELPSLWRAMWTERLREVAVPWVHTWLSHQARDDYWKHGSVCEGQGDIRCPVLLIGGWADGYTNPVFRMMARDGLAGCCFKSALVGPWSHDWPDVAAPGPQIGFTRECIKFLDKHLKGEVACQDADVADGSLRVYLKDVIAPSPFVESWPGRWIQVPAEELVDVQDPTQHEHVLRLRPSGDDVLEVFTDVDQVQEVLPLPPVWRLVPFEHSAGVSASGSWCSFGGPDLSLDQRREDALSLAFRSAPLANDVDVVGLPWIEMGVRSLKSCPSANIIVRLCCVTEAGSLLLSRGVLNLQQRNGRSPRDLKPLGAGEEVVVRFALDALGFTLPRASRLLLGLSLNYWPLVWPPHGAPPAIEVNVSQLHVKIPRLKHVGLGPTPTFEEIELADPLHVVTLRESKLPQRMVREDLVTGQVQLEIAEDDGRFQVPEEDGLEYDERAGELFTCKPGEVGSWTVENWREVKMNLGGGVMAGEACVRGQARMSTTESPEGAPAFHLTHELRAELDGEVVFERRWERTIPRV